MTRYLLSVIGPAERSQFGAYGSADEMREAMAATGAYNDVLRERGVLVFVDGLAPADTATVVDGTGPEPIFTDGPYIESKEVLNGLWIIDVPDLDEALKIATEASRVCRGTIEVRPFAG
ncbi:YciI family protein [Microbacterium sp. BWT-B31]|uniref:YciI family protein n=1 Tax=Microbacterium sp. BWT-B31 TaxID=3232072 RepID=UPI00352967E1